MKVEIFTDGSCDDRRFGGFGIMIKTLNNEVLKSSFEYCEGHQKTTSTQMELKAIIYALEYLYENNLTNCEINVYCDYFDVFDNMNSPVNLQSNAFTTSKDSILWKKIYKKSKKLNIHYHWVKSHNGHPDNIKVDNLANLARTRYILSLKEKVFVYYHQFLNISDNPAEYTLNILLNYEKSQHGIIKRKGTLINSREDKGFHSLYLLKEMFKNTLAVVKKPEDKKIIFFIDNITFVRIITALKKGSFKYEDQRYSYLWKDIMNLLKNYDIEVHKNNVKKLETFQIAEDRHNYYTRQVKKLVA